MAMTIREMAPSRRSIVKAVVAAFGISSASRVAALPPGPAAPEDADLLVTRFGARGDGSTDDSPAFEQALQAAAQAGRRLRIPAGTYRLTRTLEINRGLQIEGDGVERTVLLGAMGASLPIIHIHARETDSIIGLGLSGLRLDSDRRGAPCDGLKISTGGGGAALHQAVVRNLFITNVGIGISVSGVVYRSSFDNITISGNILEYGFYCEKNFEDITYNNFTNIEVTNVASGAYAYWIHSNYSNFVNLTSDGCCYFSSPGGSLRNLAVEGISAPKAASNAVIQLNQMQAVEGINLIGIDPHKCLYGIKIIGLATSVRAVRCYSQQPERLFDLVPNSEGVIAGVQTEHPTMMLEDYLPSTTLNRWVFQGAQSLTRRQLIYAEGNWQPAFDGWAAAPIVETATWERIGRRVFVSLSARGGVAGRSARITGLPESVAGGQTATISTGTHSLAAMASQDGSAVLVPQTAELADKIWTIEASFRTS